MAFFTRDYIYKKFLVSFGLLILLPMIILLFLNNESAIGCFYDRDICRFIRNLKTFRFMNGYSLKQVVMSGELERFTLESNVSNSFLATSLTRNGTPIFKTEMSNSSYAQYKYSNNQWVETKKKPDEEFKVDGVPVMEDWLENKLIEKAQISRISKEKCSDIDLVCIKYEIEQVPRQVKSIYFWFDDEKYLLRRIQSNSISGETIDTYYFNYL